MSGQNGFKFFSVILIIVILTYLSIFGVTISGSRIIQSAKDIRTGIDIRGGVDATLYPDKANPTDKELESAKAIIERRLDNQNVLDRNVTIDKLNKRIIVQIPWKKGEKDYNPQKAIEEIGKTALLTFQEVDENQVNKDTGEFLPTGKIVLEGQDVSDAGVDNNPQTGETVVSLKLTKEGGKKFADATGRLVGKRIAIFMDDKLITAPTVNERIPDGQAVINGQRDTKEASKLAAEIRSGSLPFRLEAKQLNSISPTLGEGALKVSVQAGAVAFALVCIFMLIFYRLPGILANIALLAHTVMQLLVISWLGITITLPGIAGIILTIGMGVDANVIIFERIKEELRNGKTLRAAIDVGFKRAFTAIFDANLTTLISAVVLFMFGTGPIKSFAITLGLGVLLNFLTAVTLTRIMVKSVANVDIAKHNWLYGV